MRIRLPGRVAPFLIVLVALSLSPASRGQTLADATLVAATATLLDPAIRLPSGSLRALGPEVDVLLHRLPDAASWTDPEAFVARGIAARLRPAFVQQVTTSFAAAGYFETGRESRPDGAGIRTRIEFEDATGRRMLLVVFDEPETVVWLVAGSR